MTGDQGPRDLAARFQFGGGRPSRIESARVERAKAFAVAVDAILGADSHEQALAIVRAAKVGSAQKKELHALVRERFPVAYKAGDRVRVISGVHAGVEGRIVRREDGLIWLVSPDKTDGAERPSLIHENMMVPEES